MRTAAAWEPSAATLRAMTLQNGPGARFCGFDLTIHPLARAIVSKESLQANPRSVQFRYRSAGF